jgi:HD-GYP domain-containing protein (c-di-GMP phosphodiesterase class II)
VKLSRRSSAVLVTVDAALLELEMNTDSQFDPLVVEVLANFVREPVAVAA